MSEAPGACAKALVVRGRADLTGVRCQLHAAARAGCMHVPQRRMGRVACACAIPCMLRLKPTQELPGSCPGCQVSSYTDKDGAPGGDAPSTFSNYLPLGAATDARRRRMVAAPGDSIVSTYPIDRAASRGLPQGYMSMSGTSMVRGACRMSVPHALRTHVCCAAAGLHAAHGAACDACGCVRHPRRGHATCRGAAADRLMPTKLRRVPTRCNPLRRTRRAPMLSASRRGATLRASARRTPTPRRRTSRPTPRPG